MGALRPAMPRTTIPTDGAVMMTLQGKPSSSAAENKVIRIMVYMEVND